MLKEYRKQVHERAAKQGYASPMNTQKNCASIENLRTPNAGVENS